MSAHACPARVRRRRIGAAAGGPWPGAWAPPRATREGCRGVLRLAALRHWFPGGLPAGWFITVPAIEADRDRVIAVDLGDNITRVLNSDYFGESKKGGLRMWNNIVYNRGGLSLHAGCKVIPVGGRNRTVLIVGLSGTGKTTTTFTSQLGSRPAQDDFIALMPDGVVHATENGCFAKTFGLNPDYEPAIYYATIKPDAYLENVSSDTEILQPRRLYERTGRGGDYAAMVARMKRERSEYLASFDGLAPSILKSIA